MNKQSINIHSIMYMVSQMDVVHLVPFFAVNEMNAVVYTVVVVCIGHFTIFAMERLTIYVRILILYYVKGESVFKRFSYVSRERGYGYFGGSHCVYMQNIMLNVGIIR